MCVQLKARPSALDYRSQQNTAVPCDVGVGRVGVCRDSRVTASRFLVSPQLVAGLAKRGYPSLRSPLVPRRRQGGQHLPWCCVCRLRGAAGRPEERPDLLNKHRVTDQIQTGGTGRGIWIHLHDKQEHLGLVSFTATGGWEKGARASTCGITKTQVF